MSVSVHADPYADVVVKPKICDHLDVCIESTPTALQLQNIISCSTDRSSCTSSWFAKKKYWKIRNVGRFFNSNIVRGDLQLPTFLPYNLSLNEYNDRKDNRNGSVGPEMHMYG